MKKLAIAALCVSAINAFAWEANVKTGFDFYRGTQDATSKTHSQDGMGWTLGAEFIPFNKGVVELGAGFENNFGVKTARYTDSGNAGKTDIYVPVYALGKLNLLRSEDNNSSLYVLGRLGYAFSNQKDNSTTKSEGGLYYGTGLGVELGHLVVEGIYDGGYRTNATSQKEFVHKAGLRVGFRFGDYKKQAPVVEEVVEKVAVEEVPAPAPVVVLPKVVKTKGLIHASCDEDAKKCIIHGFKVDGRQPNAEEQKNINEIAELINNFAKSGDVEVVGHTDSTGSVKYNQKLSEARATSVNKLLREAGLKEQIVVSNVSGKSELEPMATNKTKAGRYLNRRVEILFKDLVR